MQPSTTVRRPPHSRTSHTTQKQSRMQVHRPREHDEQAHAFTPATICDAMQKLVSNASLRNIHVTGELCNASFPHSGHVYFDLADGANKKKKLSCTYFGARNKCNADTLATLKDGGCCVVVHGSIRCVCEYGGSKYQLNVHSLSFVQSDRDTRDKQLQQWRKALTEEGVFDTSRKRHVPEYPRVVAIITSATPALGRRLSTMAISASSSLARARARTTPPTSGETISRLSVW